MSDERAPGAENTFESFLGNLPEIPEGESIEFTITITDSTVENSEDTFPVTVSMREGKPFVDVDLSQYPMMNSLEGVAVPRLIATLAEEGDFERTDVVNAVVNYTTAAESQPVEPPAASVSEPDSAPKAELTEEESVEEVDPGRVLISADLFMYLMDYEGNEGFNNDGVNIEVTLGTGELNALAASLPAGTELKVGGRRVQVIDRQFKVIESEETQEPAPAPTPTPEPAPTPEPVREPVTVEETAAASDAPIEKSPEVRKRPAERLPVFVTTLPFAGRNHVWVTVPSNLEGQLVAKRKVDTDLLIDSEQLFRDAESGMVAVSLPKDQVRNLKTTLPEDTQFFIGREGYVATKDEVVLAGVDPKPGRPAGASFVVGSTTDRSSVTSAGGRSVTVEKKKKRFIKRPDQPKR